MKYNIVIILLLCACNNYIVQNIDLGKQKLSKWCWTSVLSAAIKKIDGRDVEQCDIANVHFRRVDCCDANTECDAYMMTTEIEPIARKLGLNYEGRRTLLPHEIRSELSNGHVLIAFRVGTIPIGDMLTGHLYVIAGIDGDKILLLNPTNGGAGQWLPYSSVKMDGYYYWTETYILSEGGEK